MSIRGVVPTQKLDPVSILYKSIAGRYRPVRVADGPITARYRFLRNANWRASLGRAEAAKPASGSDIQYSEKPEV